MCARLCSETSSKTLIKSQDCLTCLSSGLSSAAQSFSFLFHFARQFNRDYSFDLLGVDWFSLSLWSIIRKLYASSALRAGRYSDASDTLFESLGKWLESSYLAVPGFIQSRFALESAPGVSLL